MDIVDHGLNILADYTIGLDKYIPVREMHRRHMNDQVRISSWTDRVISEHLMIVHRKYCNAHQTSFYGVQQEIGRKFRNLRLQETVDKVTPNGLFMELMFHAAFLEYMVVSKSAWERMKELLDQTAEQM